jgi:hypothetical protein
MNDAILGDSYQQVPDKRLILLEFNLRSLSGHYFNQLLGFKCAVEACGMEAHIFVNSDAPPELSTLLNAQRLIQWQDINVQQLRYPFDCLMTGDRQLQPLWRRLQEMCISSQDIVLVLSENPVCLYSLGVWLGHLTPQQQPAVFMRFVSAANYLDLQTREYNANSGLYRFVSQDLALRPAVEKFFYLVNNSQALTDLGRLCSRRIFLMPLPKHFGDELTLLTNSGDEILIYIHLNIRAALLINDLFQFIRKLLDSCPLVRIYIKNAMDTQRAPIVSQLSPYLLRQGVELIPAEQSHADYLRTINAANVLILPYDAVEYKIHHSGVFVEGVALGKIIVYPKDTWMEEQVVAGHAVGLGFSSATCSSLLHTVLQVIPQLARLSEQAAHCAMQFRDHNSCRHFLQLMCQLAQQSHDMRLTYVLGTPIYFNQEAGARGYLAEGWGDTESSGVWSIAQQAGIKLILQSPAKFPLTLRLDFTPFIHDAAHQAFKIYLGDYELGSWNFFELKSHSRTVLNILLPPILPDDSELQLQFHIENLRSPYELGVSPDRRRLGLMLHELMISVS